VTGRFSIARFRLWLPRMLGIRVGQLHQYPPRTPSVSHLHSAGDDRDLPAITLVTPSFNQACFVGATLRSVLEQGYPRLQYVIQDAQSSDGTAEVMKAFVGAPVDVRIEADDGQADALNRGFAGSTGEVMGYLNSDDLLLPGTLHLVGRYFRDHPSVDVIYGNRLIIDEAGREVGRWILPDHDPDIIRVIDYVPQESMFWRRGVWDRVGAGFDADLQFAMDWDLILRFLDVHAVMHHLPALFGVFRVHSHQKTQADFASSGAREIALLRGRYPGNKLGRGEFFWRHWRYLHRHRRADAAFSRRVIK
jgi:glycosyltransferase involved in cell wall biosynthesis